MTLCEVVLMGVEKKFEKYLGWGLYISVGVARPDPKSTCFPPSLRNKPICQTYFDFFVICGCCLHWEERLISIVNSVGIDNF